MSKRTQIRESAVALLKNGGLVFADRVYPNRVRPTGREILPCVCVYTLHERSEINTDGPRSYERTLDLICDLYTEETADFDRDIDDIIEAVEQILEADPTLGACADDTILKEIQIKLDEKGQTLIGAARLIYEVTYLREPPLPPYEAPVEDNVFYLETAA